MRHVHTPVRKALGDAVEPGHIAFNPAASAKAPKVERGKEPTAWTTEQVSNFLQTRVGDRLEALWIITASTGLRRSEVLGLRWSDVDPDARTLMVRTRSSPAGSCAS